MKQKREEKINSRCYQKQESIILIPFKNKNYIFYLIKPHQINFAYSTNLSFMISLIFIMLNSFVISTSIILLYPSTITNTEAFATIATNNTTDQQQQQQHHQQQIREKELNLVNLGLPPFIENFEIMDGFTIKPVLWNLSLPTSVTFDDSGNMYIAEAGFVYGGLEPLPRILYVEKDSKENLDLDNKNISILQDRWLNGPITDIEYYQGNLYVSHRGIISSIDLDTGILNDLITGLPSNGDHHNNQLAIGPDNRLYFGQGEATNSGIVGIDNYKLGWLKTIPQFHDVPAKNITLTGQNFVTENPLTSDSNDTANTGAFVSFGTSTYPGQVITGETKCNGCILSANLNGTDIQLVGWGFRSAYGMAFSPFNPSLLLVTVNGADDRGSRPITNDTEKIYKIDMSDPSSFGKFYGWPDYFGNAEPVTDPKFQSQRSNQTLQFLMQDHPPVVKPFKELQVGAALAQLDFSTDQSNQTSQLSNIKDDSFQNKNTSNTSINNTNSLFPSNMAFIAEFGIMIPVSHTFNTTEEIIGQKVVMLDPITGNYSDFLSLKSPSSYFRPVGIAFNKNENTLYVTSIGKVEIKNTLPNGIKLPEPVPWYYKNTGIVWKIVPIDKQYS